MTRGQNWKEECTLSRRLSNVRCPPDVQMLIRCGLKRILEPPELVCCSQQTENSRTPACGIRIFWRWQRNTGFDPTFQSLAVHLRRVKSQEDVLEWNYTPWTTNRLLSFLKIVHTRAVRGAKGIKNSKTHQIFLNFRQLAWQHPPQSPAAVVVDNMQYS